MTEQQPTRRSVLDRLASPALAAVAYALFSNAFTPLNTDLGWILDFGRDSLASGSLVAVNVDSFTEPQQPVVLHEWLFAIGSYLLHQRFGAAGLVALKWAFVVGIVLLANAAIRRVVTDRIVELVATLGVAHLLWPAFELVRPQLVTFLFAAAVVYAVLVGTSRALWIAAFLLLPWVNLHGGFVVGIVLLAGGCAALHLEHRRGIVDAAPSLGQLISIPLAAAVLLVFNPYGLELVDHTLHHATDEVRLLNREWLPLWRVDLLRSWERTALWILGGAFAFALLFLPKKQVRVWLLFAAGLALALSASRHLRLAPLLLGPGVAMALERAADRASMLGRLRADRIVRPVSGIVAALFLVLFLSSLPLSMRFGDQPVENPANAIAVMRSNGISGRIWNDFDWGGHLLWALPEAKVSADGRNVVAYSPAMLRTSIQFGLDGADPLATVERYGADLILLPPDHVAMPRLSERYELVYRDRDACLLSRRPEHVALAKSGKLLVPVEPLFPSDLFQTPSPDDVAPRPEHRPASAPAVVTP